MIKTSELKQKEVVSINEGKRLGIVADVEINMDTGIIESIIIPGSGKLLSLFSKESDIVINWADIKKIGVDVILVESGVALK